MPSLRNLTLLNTLVSLDIPPLPYLTHLTLTCNRWPSDGGVPVPYAVRFLQKTPNVEVANINYIVEPWPSTPFPGMDDGVPKESIPLSSLRSLTITSDPLNGSEFMRCLSLPPAVRLRVHLTKDMEYSTSTISHKQVLAKAALTSLLSGFATSSLDLTSQEISITFGFGQCIRLMIYLGALDPEKAHVDVSNQDSILELRDFMDILDSSNFNSHATKLTLFNEAANSDGDCRVPRGGKKQLAVMEAPFWRKVLPTFESLRTLCIFNTTLSFFVAILQPPSITLRDQEQEQVTLSPAFPDFKLNPLLKRVWLTAVECFPPRIVTPVEASDEVSNSATSPSAATPTTPVADETVEGHHNSPPAVTKQDAVNLDKGNMEEDEEDVGADIINLVHILKKRQEAGMPRIRLIFERCGITPRQVQLLRVHAKVHFRNN
ncbi:hypothetical protein ONZ45_g11176 [Pleurotus djamor]|nr:hypothetical protein ONZ45_g11176 [Pleurotus djamor]